MKLWHVAQWGNKDEGGNGDDTNCIVRAPDLKSAIDFAENYFNMQGHGWKNGEADVAYLMGEDCSDDDKTQLVVLIWRNPAFNMLDYPSWHRHPVTNEWGDTKSIFGEE
jgi:hypothetical protein